MTNDGVNVGEIRDVDKKTEYLSFVRSTYQPIEFVQNYGSQLLKHEVQLAQFHSADQADFIEHQMMMVERPLSISTQKSQNSKFCGSTSPWCFLRNEQ